MMKKRGAFVISLDFELFWGMADFGHAYDYKNVIEKVHDVVPKLLKLFEKYNVHATWATVGAIFAHDDDEFLEYLPKPIAPQTFEMLNKLGILPEKDETKCPRSMLFAPELTKMVSETPGQELGTHTYSHYYCNLKTSTTNEFQKEINAAKAIMEKNNADCISIVFPRNQVHEKYIKEAESEGIFIYRGVENGKLQALKKKSRKGLIFWYGDNYIPLQKGQSFELSEIVEAENRYNVKNTRFFKPYKKKYKIIEKFKLWRYKLEMRRAAKRGEVYHMYWHPHNFGENTDINFKQMEKLLLYYSKMNRKHGMISLNMREVAHLAKNAYQ